MKFCCTLCYLFCITCTFSCCETHLSSRSCLCWTPTGWLSATIAVPWRDVTWTATTRQCWRNLFPLFGIPREWSESKNLHVPVIFIASKPRARLESKHLPICHQITKWIKSICASIPRDWSESKDIYMYVLYITVYINTTKGTTLMWFLFTGMCCI